MVFDAFKRRRVVGDFYEEPVKLAAGEYEARLQVRHDSPSFLERLKDLPAILELDLDKPVALECFWSRAA